ncbi:MAG: pantetheine-phosphate adenylyltransferase [Candidatus Electrothrix sp. AW1]|nr:pantetheine-phosphate adenylyltransferase [Candidatus Electrothrix gigas]
MSYQVVPNADSQLNRPSGIAVYPGTFDPITNGHVDIVKRSLRMFDQVIVALAVNTEKKLLFPLKERVALVEQCFTTNSNVTVDTTDGLTVDYAVQQNACAIVRGLRAVSDFDYEFQLALINRKLERRVQTVFLMTGLRWIYISSSIIKNAARHGGDISGMVPAHVLAALKEKYTESK